jgi:prophage antirepressor-like protein
MNALTNFVFEAEDGKPRAMRSINIDGEPWFVAADVCAILGHSNVTQALKRLDDDEQALISNEGIHRGSDQVNVVNESGLYSLILGSRKPEAKAFKKWVTAQVLPSIRKTGSYTDPAAESLGVPERKTLFLSHGADIMVAADRTFRSLIRAGRSAGMRPAAYIQRANEMTLAKTGVNLLDELDWNVIEEPPTSPLDTGAHRRGEAAACVRDFWDAVGAGFMGMPGPLPMLSFQAQQLYDLWASQEDRWLIPMTVLIATTRKLGIADTQRLRWRRDMGGRGSMRQSTFLIPAGLNRFDPSQAVAFMESLLPVVETA